MLFCVVMLRACIHARNECCVHASMQCCVHALRALSCCVHAFLHLADSDKQTMRANAGQKASIEQKLSEQEDKIKTFLQSASSASSVCLALPRERVRMRRDRGREYACTPFPGRKEATWLSCVYTSLSLRVFRGFRLPPPPLPAFLHSHVTPVSCRSLRAYRRTLRRVHRGIAERVIDPTA